MNDPEAIRAYKGHGDHLVRYFTMSEREYLMSFRDREVFAFTEFRTLLDALGVDAGIRRLCAPNGLPVPSLKVIEPYFDAQQYLEANPELRAAQVPGLLHFWKHGRAEGRPRFAMPRQAVA